jgi:hypothetical protein
MSEWIYFLTSSGTLDGAVVVKLWAVIDGKESVKCKITSVDGSIVHSKLDSLSCTSCKVEFTTRKLPIHSTVLKEKIFISFQDILDPSLSSTASVCLEARIEGTIYFKNKIE